MAWHVVCLRRYDLPLKWWRTAWPRKQLLVLNFDTLVADGDRFMKEVLAPFTGLDGLHSLPHVNEQSSPNKVRRLSAQL